MSVAAVLLMASVFVSGCDGALGISGTVYEWVDPPPDGTSAVYVDQSIPESVNATPLQGAFIEVEPKQLLKNGTWHYWSINATSNSTGEFHGFSVEDPAKTTYVVIVTKEGYGRAAGEFVSPVSDNFDHVIRAILVKIPSQN